MRYQEYSPSLQLRPYIEKIWTSESDASDTYPIEHLITPFGVEGLVITYQPAAQKFILNNKPTLLPEVYLFIQPLKPWTVITEGCSGILGVFFRAGSLHSILKSSMQDVVGHIIELQSFIGSKPVRLLREQLIEALPDERIALVEGFFSKYFYSRYDYQNTTQLAVNLIRQHKGKIPIEQLAAKLGVSRQALARQFAEKAGVSPKFYSRMIHFSAVQKFLNNHPHASWLDITYRFGYSDQSHLIKDFYEFTGTSPKGYAALDTFLVNNFALPDIDTNLFKRFPFLQ